MVGVVLLSSKPCDGRPPHHLSRSTHPGHLRAVQAETSRLAEHDFPGRSGPRTKQKRPYVQRGPMPSTRAVVIRLTGRSRHPHGRAPTCRPWPILPGQSQRIESQDDRLQSPMGQWPAGTLPATHTLGRVAGPTSSNHGALDSHRLSVGSGTLLRQDAGSSPIIGNPSTRRKPPTAGFPAALTWDNDTLYPR